MKASLTTLSICLLSVFSFGQDILQKYQQMAIDSSPSLQAQYKQYEMALQQIPQAKSLPDPKLSLAFGIRPIETRLGPQQAKLSVLQMFPWFGTLSAKEKQMAHLAQAEHARFISVQNKLVYQVSVLWFDLYFLKQSITITQQQIEILSLLVRQANVRFESNQSGMVDVLRFQMKEEELRTQKEHLHDRQKTKRVHLNSLLNRAGNTEVELVDSLELPVQKLFVLDSIFTNNPHLQIIDEAMVASEAQLQSSRLSAYPSIGIGVDYAFIGERKDMQVARSATDAIMPMVSISLPIFRKKYRAKRLEAELNKDRLAKQKQSIKQKLIAEHQQNTASYTMALRNLSLNESLLVKANQALRILNTAYENSGKSYDELLAVQNLILKYKLAYNKSITDLYKAIVYREKVLLAY